MCVTQKHFKSALRLANMCKLSCAPVIQEFTASCVALAEDAVTWHWLKNNEIDGNYIYIMATVALLEFELTRLLGVMKTALHATLPNCGITNRSPTR